MTTSNRKAPARVTDVADVDVRVKPVVDDFVTALLTASRVLVGVSARSLVQAQGTVTVTQFRTLVVL